MAKRRAQKKRVKKTARKAVRRKSSPKKAARRRPAARKARRPSRPPRRAAAPRTRHGVITHTELASADPAGTRAWCETVLGWTFGEPVPTEAGPYHMWRFANGTGGGIRAHHPPEVPGSIPYCEVEDIQGIFSRALAAGATTMMPPAELPGGMGWIAIVAAPGGVPIGFWAAR